jgi:hypothetical protein
LPEQCGWQLKPISAGWGQFPVLKESCKLVKLIEN